MTAMIQGTGESNWDSFVVIRYSRYSGHDIVLLVLSESRLGLVVNILQTTEKSKRSVTVC